MKRCCMIMSAVALVAVLGSPALAQDAKIQKGMKVFGDQKCSLCHSIADKGNKKGPLDGVGAKLSADDIKKWVTNAKEMAVKAKADRKPPMKNYALPAEDLDAVVAYVASLKK